jgi:hypothetical protein
VVTGKAVVTGEARVAGKARVEGEARVAGEARVEGDGDYICVGPIGSRQGYTTFIKNGELIFCGCFSGTLAEFESKVESTHGASKYGDEYRAAIAFFKALKAIK